jgi:hypothetical protein
MYWPESSRNLTIELSQRTTGNGTHDQGGCFAQLGRALQDYSSEKSQSETVMIVDYVQARESDLRRVDHGDIAEQTGDTRIDHRRAR